MGSVQPRSQHVVKMIVKLGAASKVIKNEKRFSGSCLVEENRYAEERASASLGSRETVDLILCGCFSFNYFWFFKFIIFFTEI